MFLVSWIGFYVSEFLYSCEVGSFKVSKFLYSCEVEEISKFLSFYVLVKLQGFYILVKLKKFQSY